jgi:hypothetical protein
MRRRRHDRVERVTQFGFHRPRDADRGAGADVDQAHARSERANSCLITNSLKASVQLETKV